MGGRSWLITAQVEVTGPAQGVLYARGGHNVGHSFFLLGGTTRSGRITGPQRRGISRPAGMRSPPALTGTGLAGG
jgi:hypothetical protein